MADRQEEYELDEGVEGQTDDTTTVDDDDEDDFEILVEGRDEIPPDNEETSPADEGPSKEELLSELEVLRQKQTAAEDRQTLQSGFDKLSQILEKQQSSATPTTPSEPQETWEDLKKRLSQNFYDDPVGAMDEMVRFAVQREIVPAFQQTQNQLAKTATLTSKQAASANPTNKLILENYGDEVEEMVKTLPPGPDVYDRACQQVGFNHLTDLVELKTKEQAATASRPTSNVHPTGRSPSRGQQKPKKRRVLTKQQREYADRVGLTYEAAWRYFNENE